MESVDPGLLFQRLLDVVERTPDDIEDAFSHELSNLPTTLFDTSVLPRLENKSIFAQYLWDSTSQESARLPDNVCFVIDGGSLLHRLPWPQDSTFNQLVEMYTHHVVRTYVSPVIVFHGYSGYPSTKDIAHMRRTNGGNISTDIAFQGDMVLTDSKERFLRNPSNKQRFIRILSSALQLQEIKTHHASADADCLILKTLDTAIHGDAVLICEDTDFLVLLVFHSSAEHNRVFMRSSTFKCDVRIWDIKQVQGALGPNLCKYILFAHAIGGCDTTSSLFGIGKSLPLKCLKDSSAFKENAHIFMLSSNHEQIIAAGEGALVVLYGGKPHDTLNKFRHVKYMQKLATSRSSLQPNKLPPTSAAAKFHSFRTYFQVQEWRNANNAQAFTLDPED